MSDVTVAPPSAAPSAAPSPSNEAVINQNPVSSPAPIGSQTPPAFEDDARTSIQKAFDRAKERSENPPKAAKQPERKPAPAADAKAGHNQPPEETEKIDLRKRPQDIPRGERGQFAPRQQAEAQNAAVQSKGTTGTRQESSVHTLPDHAPFRDPPPRMADHAKREWAVAPESVRGEVYRMHHEMGQAYQRYRADYETMNTLRPYQEMAHKSGTTIDKALNNYVTIEEKLRADPIAGIETIIHNLNLVDPQTGKRADIRDFAYAVLSRSPEQLQQMQQGNVQHAAAQQIGALHQEVKGLKDHLQQMHNAQQFVYTRSQVDQFAENHPRLDELGGLIKNEIDLGFDLETAYRRADLLHPATQAAQTRAPSAQTRSTDRSIYGAPSGVSPSNGASRRQASGSPEEAMTNAFRRFHGHA